MATTKTKNVEFAVMCEKIDTIKADVSEIKQKLENNYVTKDQFTPVKNIVYGLVGTLLTALIGAIIMTVLK